MTPENIREVTCRSPRKKLGSMRTYNGIDQLEPQRCAIVNTITQIPPKVFTIARNGPSQRVFTMARKGVHDGVMGVHDGP